MPTDATREQHDKDRKQEEAVRDSFPASDPPAASGIVGPGGTVPPGEDGRTQRPGQRGEHKARMP